MKLSLARLLCVLAVLTAGAAAQEVIPLYPGTPPGSVETSYPEKQYFSRAWNTEVVSNVTKPTLTLYRPVAGGNGNAVVICPGGGFMALSIESEGIAVAKWLAARGVTAFVLKYRLAHSGDDATQEFMSLFAADKPKFEEMIKKTVPLSIADGLAAVEYVRKHAADWGISPDKVGIIGFSAGGTVTAAVGLHYTPEGRPAFVAPIYPATSMLKNDPVPSDAPPMFLVAATDDQLGLAPDSIGLYDQWSGAHKSVELHMYAKGGHGFGMRQQGYPSDHWIDRLAEWLESQGFLKR